MTPQQQADYDYAMSQIKPRVKIQFAEGAVPTFWEMGKMPMLTIKYDPGPFTEAMNKARDAMIYASMGIPKSIFEGSSNAKDPS